jgi:two-component system sensor histidine kinase YesM
MLKRKIIIMTLTCILAAGIPLSLFYVNNITNSEKRLIKNSDTIYINFIKDEFSDTFIKAKELALYCISDYRIINFFNSENINKDHRKLEAFVAYEMLGRFLTSSEIGSYVNKLIVFDDNDLVLQANTRILGSFADIDNIRKSSIWDMEKGIFHFSKDITYNKDCVALLLPFENKENTYVYFELSMDIFNKTQNINAPTLNFTLIEGNKTYLDPTFDIAFLDNQFTNKDQINYFESEIGSFINDGKKYDYDYHPIINTDFALLSVINYEPLGDSLQKAVFSTLYVSFSALTIALLLAFGLSPLITKRSDLIIRHINKIKDEDFTPNPNIAKGNDEFSQIGDTLNEMGVEIEDLLEQTKRHCETEKKQELALLQKQVNPHFLYNTLESIYWMAKIQKTPGIAKMTRALSDLLKNIAKGTDEKITLREELRLLNSYIQIQKIRYVEMFDYINDIPEEYLDYKIMKFTLQPLIENSIYHGIEPKGEYGTIRVFINSESDDQIEIAIEDDGVGIKKEVLEKIFLVDEVDHNHKGLNSIGLKNVNDRIQLTYAKEFGLKIESEVNVGTKIIIKLLKEL